MASSMATAAPMATPTCFAVLPISLRRFSARFESVSKAPVFIKRSITMLPAVAILALQKEKPGR